MTRPAYDVDLEAWRNKFAFHPADTKAKQLGHQLARKAVMHLAELLHWLVPASDDKSTMFRLLGDVLMLANRSLATNGGPHLPVGDEQYLEVTLQAALREYERTDLPEDPRIREYEAEQRGEGRAEGLVEHGGRLESVGLTLPADAASHVSLGLTGAVVTEAAEPRIAGEQPTADAETFRESFQDGDCLLKVVGGRGYVAIATTLIAQSPHPLLGPVGSAPAIPEDDEGDFGWYVNLTSPTAVNQLLSAIAAAGDRSFSG